jgi:F like protein
MAALALDWTPLIEALEKFSARASIRARASALRPLQSVVEKAWATHFRRQGEWWIENHLPRLRSLVEAAQPLPGPGERALDALDDFDADRAMSVTLTQVGRAMEAGAARAFATLEAGLSFTLSNPRAAHHMDQIGANLVRGLNLTSRDRLRTLLTEGIESGWSYSRLASRVRVLFADFSRSRALTIARTELGNAYSEATVIVGDSLRAQGLQVEKRWVAVQNEPGEPCRVNANQGWIPMGQVFSSGDVRPLQHPNCKCALVVRTRT